MAVAFKLDDGRHELQLPDGSTVKTALSPGRLEDIGYEIQDKPKESDLRLASNDFYGADRGALTSALKTDDEKAGMSLPDVNASVIPPESSYDRKEREASKAREDAEIKKLADKGIKPLEGMSGGGAPWSQVEHDAHAIAPQKANDNATPTPVPSNDNAGQASQGPTSLFGRPTYARVKGGDKRVAFNRVAPTLGYEELEPALANASIDKKLAAQNLADIEEHNLDVQSGQAGREARQAQLDRDSYAAKKVAWDADYKQRVQGIENERQAADNLKIDPKRFWANQSTGGKILAAISMMAGGVLQGMGRTKENPGYQMIQNAINQDIQEQKDRRQMRLEGLRMRETQLDRLVALYGSPQLAEQELRNRQNSVASAMAKKFAIDAKHPEVQARLGEYLADSDEERAKERVELNQKFGEHVQESWANIPDHTVQTGGTRPMTTEQRKRMVMVDGTPGFVANESGQQDVQKKVTGMGYINDQLSVLEERIKQTSPTDTAAMRKLDAQVVNLVNDISLAQEQGITRKEDFEMAQQKLGNAQAWTGNKANALERLGATRQYFEERRRRTVQDNVFADPNTTTPLLGQTSTNRRPF